MSYYLIGLSHGLESVTAELLQTREGHKKMYRTAIATIAFLGLIVLKEFLRPPPKEEMPVIEHPTPTGAA